jgi:hypothetical protein
MLQITEGRPDKAFPVLQIKLTDDPILTAFFVLNVPLTGAGGRGHSISEKETDRQTMDVKFNQQRTHWNAESRANIP